MSVQLAIKERPILFSGAMVRAILDGKKTQTRRVLKFPSHTYTPDAEWVKSVNEDGGGNWVAASWNDKGVAEFTKKAYPNGEGFPCPYGQPGDKLWCRETWQLVYERKGGQRTTQPDVMTTYVGAFYEYAATCQDCPPRWRPSIHMPRKASRITLEVTALRVERLQDISEADAKAEGLYRFISNLGARNSSPTPIYNHDGNDLGGFTSPVEAFENLWDSINAKRGYGWASNPWVWVIEFKRVTNGA